MKITTIFMMLISICAHGQYTLKTGSIISIDNITGDMSVFTENELLQCGDPVVSETITYIDCGFGSTLGANGKCQVAANDAFEIDYGLEDAATCQGLNGTPEWRGQHPIGSGTGDYSFNINNRITGEVIFTLECQPQATQHSYKRVLYRSHVDLRNLIESSRASVLVNDSLFSISTTSGEVSMVPLKYEFNKAKMNDAQFMIRQLGETWYLLPVNDSKEVMVNYTEQAGGQGLATYMQVVGSSPKGSINEINQPRARGECDSLSDDNKAGINLVFDKGLPGCYVDMRHSAYLVWYLLEK